MPEFTERFEHEAAIASTMSDVLADARAAYDRGEAMPWDAVKMRTQDVLEDELLAVYVIVFLMMASDGLQNGTVLAQSLGRAWVSAHARGLATAMTTNMRRELASGTPPESVFGDTRVSVLAATEVTRAISRAELDARRSNAAAEGKQKPAMRRDSPDVRPVEPVEPDEAQVPAEPATAGASDGGSLLDVGDGLTALWITERDDRVCPICRPLNKRPARDWDTLFPQGPPAHPNCRCHLEYVPARRYRPPDAA